MTGWRLGWMVVPKSLLPAINRLQQNFFISVSLTCNFLHISVATWSQNV